MVNSNSNKFFERYIWPIERTQTSTTAPGQSSFVNNDNKGVFHIFQISKSPESDVSKWHSQNTSVLE